MLEGERNNSMCRRRHHLSVWCLSVFHLGLHSHLGHLCVPFTVQMVQIDFSHTTESSIGLYSFESWAVWQLFWNIFEPYLGTYKNKLQQKEGSFWTFFFIGDYEITGSWYIPPCLPLVWDELKPMWHTRHIHFFAFWMNHFLMSWNHLFTLSQFLCLFLLFPSYMKFLRAGFASGKGGCCLRSPHFTYLVRLPHKILCTINTQPSFPKP